MTLSKDALNTLENLKVKNKLNNFSIYVVLILAILLSLISLFYLNVDITSQNKAIVKSKRESITIQTAISGKVKEEYFENNIFHATGDTLAIIGKDFIDSSKGLNDSLYIFHKNYLSDIKKLLNSDFKNLITTTAQKEFNTYTGRNRELNNIYSFAKKQYDRQKILFEKQVIAQSVYDLYIFELEKALSSKNAYKSQQKTTWELKKRELEVRLVNLSNVQENLAIQAQDYVITAPISGTIENYQGITVGSNVFQGQILAIISPDNDLIIESAVKPSDIGLIKIGQSVRYQFDAFNYNQWGFLDGEVIDIDKNITLSETGAFFKVRCSLPKKALTLKNGYEAHISKGMTLTARYFITRRSLWNLLFDKVDDWFNPKLVTTPA